MLMKSVLVIYLVLFSNVFTSDEEKINSRNREALHNKHTSDTNKKDVIFKEYLNNIEDAVKSYKPCDDKRSCYRETVNEQLAKFPTESVSKTQLDLFRDRAVTYQVLNHRLYRQKNCKFPARCDGIEYFILKIIDKLPNIEFLVNVGDHPVVHSLHKTIAPVFSFSKTGTYVDVLMPAWSFWAGGPAISIYPRGIGRWDLLRNSITAASDKFPWDKKIRRAFFRGSRTNVKRDTFVQFSREFGQLLNAQYTKNQAYKSEADTLYQKPAPEVTFEHHCKYRYLLNIAGVSASFRFKHLFLCKSLVLHQEDEWTEFFYKMLKPWVHYIPISEKPTKDEIHDKIQFAMDYDSESRKIAERGYDFIWNNLQMDDIIFYWEYLLRRYKTILNFKPKLNTEFIEIYPKMIKTEL